MAKLLNLKIYSLYPQQKDIKCMTLMFVKPSTKILKFIARSVSEYAHMVKMFLLSEELLLQLWNALLLCTWCTNLLFLYC